MKLRPYLLLLVFAIVPYLAGIAHEFVYDDDGAIVENRFLSAPGAWQRALTLRTFSEPRTLDATRPTLLVSMLLDHATGPKTAWRYRATNIALHAGCTLLLYSWLIGLLLRNGDKSAAARAFVAALIFAVHPLASEAIQVPSFREDPLSLFWMLVVLNLMPIRNGWVRTPLQAAAWLLALGAKESALVLPALVAAIWWTFPAERPSLRRGSSELVVAALLLLGFAAFAVSAHPPQALDGPWNGLSLRWPENIWTAPWLFLRYIKLLIAPWPLAIDRVVTPITGALAPRFFIGLFSVLAAALFVLVARRKNSLSALGVTWLLIAFLPISNIIPLHNPVADRYAYALVAGFALLPAALPLDDRVIRRGVIAIAVVYVALLELRLPDFANDTALWFSNVRVEPHSARAQTGLGLAAWHSGDLETAIQYFSRADELNPRDVTAMINLAVMDARTNNLDAASEKIEEALRRRPDKPEAWATLALVREAQGRREEAMEAAENARKNDPLGRY